MKLLSLLGAVFLVSPFSVVAAENPGPFPELKIVDVRSPHFKIRVHYDPSITTIINRPLEQKGIGSIKVLTTKIDRSKNQVYEIQYTDGPSADPAFWVFKNGGEEVGGFAGTELYLPGNGSLYVSGHTNSLFNHRTKYDLKGGKFSEVKQPFYYVGLDSKALRDITIYSDKKLAFPVANIPTGAMLSVLVNEGDFFLIKTQFGLLGWVHFKPERLDDNLIEGLFFMGD
jgi:hypothetical protein